MAAISCTSCTWKACRQKEGHAPPARPRRVAAARACITPWSPPTPKAEACGNSSPRGGLITVRTISGSVKRTKPGLVQQRNRIRSSRATSLAYWNSYIRSVGRRSTQHHASRTPSATSGKAHRALIALRSQSHTSWRSSLASAIGKQACMRRTAASRTSSRP